MRDEMKAPPCPQQQTTSGDISGTKKGREDVKKCKKELGGNQRVDPTKDITIDLRWEDG